MKATRPDLAALEMVIEQQAGIAAASAETKAKLAARVAELESLLRDALSDSPINEAEWEYNARAALAKGEA